MTQLFVHQTGSPDDPAIVFLHGGGLSGRMWAPQLERLSGYFCLAPDLPEHGQSAAVKPLTLKGASQAISDLIREKVPSGRAHLVGLSYGGVIAQAVMNDCPDVVETALLSGTSARMGKTMVALQNLNVPILRMLRPDQLAWLMSLQFGIPAAYQAVLAKDMQAFTPIAFQHMNSTYAEIVTPTHFAGRCLVTAGQKETFVAKDMARKLAKMIPGAKSATVAGLGHVWNLQDPDLFTQALKAWITNQPLPERVRYSFEN